MTDVVLYQLESFPNPLAKAPARYIAYVVLPDGNLWGVRFEGSEANIVTANAIAFYEAEKVKQERIRGSSDDEVMNFKPSTTKTDMRGAHFVGKTWMVNHTTKQKIRVDQSQVNEYKIGRAHV